jgi:hypothetical protein
MKLLSIKHLENAYCVFGKKAAQYPFKMKGYIFKMNGSSNAMSVIILTFFKRKYQRFMEPFAVGWDNTALPI